MDQLKGRLHFGDKSFRHSKYGNSFKINRYERAKTNCKGLVKYFSSSHFKGIGLKTAKKCVDSYGEATIDEILEHPEKLVLQDSLCKIAEEEEEERRRRRRRSFLST